MTHSDPPEMPRGRLEKPGAFQVERETGHLWESRSTERGGLITIVDLDDPTNTIVGFGAHHWKDQTQFDAIGGRVIARARGLL